jgi:creatinine amidohydrolase
LPLDVDVTIAVAQARAACELLTAQGVACFIAPPLAYGLTNFTEGFAGRLTLRPGTLFTLLEDVVEALGQEGAQRIVLSNAHLEPAHIEIIRALVLDFPAPQPGPRFDKPHVIFPDNTRRRWAATLGEEFVSGECHAGRYEGSIVMAADPESVRAGELAALEPVDLHLIDSMRAGKKSFREMGSEAAYCGDPAAATAEEGADLIERLAEMLVTSVRETWPELG